MACTVSVTYNQDLMGGARLIAGTITGDSSWLAAGEVCDLSAYFSGSPVVIPSSDDGYLIKHDRGTAAAGKILAYYADYDAGADGAMIAVPDTTDLSAMVVPFIAIGTKA